MKTLYHWLLLLPLITTQLLAQTPLPPQQPASLYQHLLEINQQWSKYAVPEAWKTETMTFHSDRARIAEHLFRVHSILKQRPVSHLTDAQVENRQELLAALERYAETGQFPINTHHAFRIPYFIDDYGTACAVGHLLIQSGQEDFAQQIRQEMNYAYIAEMPYSALGTWANEQGFTGDELAWVQPGYPPADPFTIMGSGADGPVSVIASDTANDRVFFAGDFQQVNGTSCQNVAGWDGSQFFALGDGLDGSVQAMTLFEGKLYAGGTFTGPINDMYNLAVWDGTDWTLSNVFEGDIRAFYVHQGELYAAGSFGIAGTATFIYYNVAKWESDTWIAVGNGSFDGPVETLATYQGDLVAGGAFQAYETDSLAYVARYTNGAWTSLGTGLDNVVLTLLTQEDTLYAGGKFFDALQQPTFGLARIDTGGWNQLIDPSEYIKPWATTYSEYISLLHLHSTSLGSELYAGGYFAIYPLVGTFGNNVAMILRQNDDFLLHAFSDPDSSVQALGSTWNGDLLIGGDFTGHLSKTGAPIPPTAIHGMLRVPRLAVYPNPVSSSAVIELTDISWKPGMQLRVLTAMGQPVAVPYSLDQQELRLSAAQLPRGTYFFELISNDSHTLGHGRFVVQ